MDPTDSYNIDRPPTYCPECVDVASTVHLVFSLNESVEFYGQYSLVCDHLNHRIHTFPLGVAPRNDRRSHFHPAKSAENDSEESVHRCAFRGICESPDISAECGQGMCALHCRETGGCSLSGHEQPPHFKEGLNILSGALANNKNYPEFLRWPVFRAPCNFTVADYTIEARKLATRRAQVARMSPSNFATPSPSPSPPLPVHEVVVYTWTENGKPVQVESHEVQPQNPWWSRPGQSERYETYSFDFGVWEDVPHDHLQRVVYGQPILVRERDVVGSDEGDVMAHL